MQKPIKTLLIALAVVTLGAISCQKENVEPEVKVSTVEIQQKILNLYRKNTKRLILKVTPESAASLPVTWSSSDPKVATVDKDGLLTAVGKGKAFITAKIGDKDAICAVTVNPDVYFCGESKELGGKYGRATVWLNGAIEYLLDDGKADRSLAYDLCMSGDDVIVVGTIGGKAAMWKNNEPTVKLEGSEVATTLACSGAESHILSDMTYTSTYDTHSLYWKNGVKQDYKNLDLIPNATKVMVVGSDLYMSGYKKFRGEGKSQCTVLKNGEILFQIDFAFEGISIRDMAISGNDVYLVGKAKNVLKVWKNGQEVSGYEDLSSHFELSGIYADKGDIYVVGNKSMANESTVWKNGKILFNIRNYKVEMSDITVYEGDVYTVGYIDKDTRKNAAVWMNGELKFEVENGFGYPEAVIIR